MSNRQVKLTFGCDNCMMLVLRMTTVGVLAQASMALDRVDEIKLAVDEAAKQFISAAGGKTLMAEYTMGGDALHIVIGTEDGSPIAPNADEWMVLLCVLESMGCEVNVWGGENPHALELICCA